MMARLCLANPFANAKALTTHKTQYFEMFGNRGIYQQGWTAVTRHSIPWDLAGTPPKFSQDKWELYNTNDDFSQSQDLAAKYPDKLAELQRLFLAEAEKYNVLPLDDRRVERFVPTIAGKAYFLQYRTSLTDTGWKTASGIVGDGSVRALTDSILNAPSRFYRVRQQ